MSYYTLIPLSLFIIWIVYSGGIRIPTDITINGLVQNKTHEYEKLYSIIEIPVTRYLLMINGTLISTENEDIYNKAEIGQYISLDCVRTLIGDYKINCRGINK